jgi:hypothetical protein
VVTDAGITYDLEQNCRGSYEVNSMIPQVYTRQNIQDLAKQLLKISVTDRKFYDIRSRYSELDNVRPNIWTLRQAKLFLTVVHLVERFRNHKTVEPLLHTASEELSELLDDSAVSLQDYISHVKKLY